jgi:hypothetical protein
LKTGKRKTESMMGDLQHNEIMNGALEGPVVAAAPGYFVLYNPSDPPEPYMVLPVTRCGCPAENRE